MDGICIQNEWSLIDLLCFQTGDVVLMHPFMLHTVSVNATRRPRIITNPAPTLRYEQLQAPSIPAPSPVLLNTAPRLNSRDLLL